MEFSPYACFWGVAGAFIGMALTAWGYQRQIRRLYRLNADMFDAVKKMAEERHRLVEGLELAKELIDGMNDFAGRGK